MHKYEIPPLAHYAARTNYQPRVGDFIIWTGWISTWYGVVSAIDGETLQVVFAKLPMILFTMTPDEQRMRLRALALGQIRFGMPGAFCVHQHDQQHNAVVWYV